MAVLSQKILTVEISTWEGAFEGWLRGGQRSERTIQSYRQDCAAFAAFFEQANGQPFSPELITSLDLRGFREHSLAGQQVSAATWNRRRVSLKMLCQWAQESGLVSYNPFQGVQPAQKQQTAPRWLNRQDYGRLMRTIERMANMADTPAGQRQAVRDQAMVYLMVFAGLREGEVCALDVADVKITERKGRVLVRRGKGDKEREVPLNNTARQALSCWLAVHEGGAALFYGKRGARLSERAVQRRVREIGRLAGVDLTPHVLRHTFAKRTLDQGAPLTVVSKLLGHARLETTARYVQPGWEDFERAVENL